MFLVKLPAQLSRPSKVTNAQTILCEIDMLRFAAASFEGPEDRSSWRNLECFLLPFRNLIEFSGKAPTRDDLSITKPEQIWPVPATRPSRDKLDRLRRADLWAKYEVRVGTSVNDKISRYLHHCTEQRVDGKDWNIREMFGELNDLMSEFEKLLPDKRRPWGALPNFHPVMLPTSHSTATPGKRTVLGLSPLIRKERE